MKRSNAEPCAKIVALPLEEVSTVRGSGWVDDQYANLLMILNLEP